MPEPDEQPGPQTRLGARVKLRDDHVTGSEVNAWIHRRGRAEQPAPEREAEHEPERERLPGIDGGAGWHDERRLKLAPNERVNRRIRSSLRRFRFPEADSVIGEEPRFQ